MRKPGGWTAVPIPASRATKNPWNLRGLRTAESSRGLLGAERAGFEPAEGFYPLAALAKRREDAATAAPACTSDDPPSTLALPLAPDTDLARVVGAWATLPEPIRRVVVALVSA